MSNTKCAKYNQFSALLEEFKALTLVATLPYNTWTTNVYCSQDHDSDYTPKHEECLQSVCPDNSLQASLQAKTHSLLNAMRQRTEKRERTVTYFPVSIRQEIILK